MTTPPSNPSVRDVSTMPEPSRMVRSLALACSALIAVSVVPVLYVTLMAGPAKLWFSTLFELTVLGGAVVGILAGMGRFRDGWALSLACVGGTLLVTAVFATVEIRANFRDDPSVGRLIIPFAGMRLAFAGVFAALASWAVWSRDRRSWGFVVKAALVLAPVAGVGAWLATGNAGFLTTPLGSPSGEALRIAGMLVGGLIGIVLVSVGGHLLIRSYELGRPGTANTASGS